MQQFKVTNYELQGDNIVATVIAEDTKTAITIGKGDFEHWLTEGTGEVAYFLPELDRDNDIIDRIGRMPVADFWSEVPVVILADIYGYLARSQGNRKEIMAEISLQRSLDEIAMLIPLSTYEKAFIHVKMSQYGFNRSMATIEKMAEVGI
jgi:hypothetical protein